MKKTFLLLSLLLCAVGHARLLKTYQLDGVTPAKKGLAGNGVSDIKESKAVLWLGTGHGLSQTADNAKTFDTFGVTQGVGAGSVSGLGSYLFNRKTRLNYAYIFPNQGPGADHLFSWSFDF